ncbi:MAG: AAA family ATPase, partial [Planctomycetaceae bacterium]|nr:AAA family ATPase [Planctomycetaceae bacterium]
MSDTQRVVRIFISSPGDVTEERENARRVIDGLQKRYPDVSLQSVLWEDLALPATASFQETIELILHKRPIDIAVFILWSRLGSPLTNRVLRPDGTEYRSGTEREFDLMLKAFEQSDKQRPVMLAYVRDDVDGFEKSLSEDKAEEMIAQRKLAKSFIREQFHDADGRNLRAYQTYREPVDFVGRLRAHLQQSLDDLLGMEATPRWHEEPYRGLEVFDVRHADIFRGRDEETCDLMQRLRDQRRAGCAFAVIVGASGAGKSSLARAGVAASLLQHSGEDGVKAWRTEFFVPALGASDLLARLTRSLFDALPELRSSATALEDVTSLFAQDTALAVRLSIAPAFSRAAEQSQGVVRLLLVIDQMEELWTDRRITAEDRERFLAVIEALARSGHVVV